jgi:fusion protein PurCD
LRILHTTDRISAFDVILPFEVPGKGEILQALSTWFFRDTEHIVPNHLVGCLDRTHVLAREALVLPFEFVVRGVLTGSLWRLYDERGPRGVEDTYGITLPAGLARNCALEAPLLTPTTKSEAGHDKPILASAMTPVLSAFLETHGLDPAGAGALLEDVRTRVLALFAHGRRVALERGLVLVDTKYEFGLAMSSDGKRELVLVDEVHTPDSSRYWLSSDVEEGRAAPRQLSKEFLREELMAHFGKPEDFGPTLPHHAKFDDAPFVERLAASIGERYREMFRLFLGEATPFEVCKPHLVPWPLSPSRLREVENALRLPSKILVVGNGGRDWSLFDFFSRLPEVSLVYCAPGNRDWGTAEHGKYRECPLADVQAIATFARDSGVGLVVSGPEIPLCEGLAAACAAVGVPCLGPDLAGASLEASKVFCKELACAADIPGAAFECYGFTELSARMERRTQGETGALRLPCAVKYDGLAAGKGVFICRNEDDLRVALASLRSQVPAWEAAAAALPAPSASKARGEAQFLVEDLLEGEEISVLALCNGTEFRLLPLARDYKRRDDGQRGPNTGGMGSVCPVEVSPQLAAQIDSVFRSALSTLAARGTPYRGFLFAGLMVDARGTAWLLEFNCRLGDPETQSVLPGLGREFAMELQRAANGLPFVFPERAGRVFEHDGRKRVYVVGASPEYPDASAPARPFAGPRSEEELGEGVLHVPTAIEPDGTTRGGRAFGYLGTASTYALARARAYEAMALARLGEVLPHYRTDVAVEFVESDSP